ncbi:hypothetical protein CLOSTASPAR_00924 [[Clostridium] asparagiforme DSM 15981]|uniref:Uncharacterized protein n=1 Tax=[Clostridium] asparagiforme DSM 15981 TaxID=518636 RepID=C0CVC1_9FIRM|nr:hypothetical protein CLOSTASPAR_00924 [[Clostridium] asparagiforme DSM 15981]
MLSWLFYHENCRLSRRGMKGISSRYCSTVLSCEAFFVSGAQRKSQKTRPGAFPGAE